MSEIIATEFLMLTCIAGLMIISPGPDFAIVVKNSLMHGRGAGLLASLGVGLANLCHVLINLLGIGLVIAESVVAFTVIKFLGAAYLLYIGFKGIRAKAPKPKTTMALKENDLLQKSAQNKNLKTARSGFLSGFLTCMLNPKACLFFLSFFSVILTPTTGIQTQIFYGVWISSMAVLWFALVALFFSTKTIGGRLAASKHWLDRITGGILMLLGLKLLKTEALI